MWMPLESLIVTSVRFTGRSPVFMAIIAPVFPTEEQDAASIIRWYKTSGRVVVWLLD